MNLEQCKKLFETYKEKAGDFYYESDEFLEEFYILYGRPMERPDQMFCEFRALLEYYIELKPKTILEIGTFHGGSLWYWVNFAPLNATIISVDTNHDQSKFVFGELESMRPDINLVKVTGDSSLDETMQKVLGIADTFDFVFIDGYHLFPVIRSDWERYGKRSKVCAFHDIGSGHELDNPQDVRVLWNEITNEYSSTLSMIRREPADLSYGIGIVELGETK